jgi:Protein of unknown function (DUF669)
MAFLGGTFDANSVEPSAPIEVLPPGKYPAQIVNSEMRETKTGGQMLWLEMEIVDGTAKGRKLWDRLNLVNSNTTAVEIAQRTLSAICHAAGKLQVSDSEELHFKPMLVTVKVRPAGPDKQGVQREAQNEIGGYAALGSAPVAQPVAARPAPVAPVARPASAAAAASAPPWRRTA